MKTLISINLPTGLTLLRIALIPILIMLFYLPFPWAATLCAVIFAIAALTDWLDGYLARTLNQTSAFGAFLDPVADKLIVVVVLMLLVDELHALYFTLPAIVIVGREIVVSALREWMAELGRRASVSVTFISKIKTVLQMLALIVLLAIRHHSDLLLLVVGYILLYLAVLLTLWTMYVYLKAAWLEIINADR